jgi:hypothetical protein
VINASEVSHVATSALLPHLEEQLTLRMALEPEATDTWGNNQKSPATPSPTGCDIGIYREL